MKIEEKSFVELIGFDMQFVLPAFQREYVWKKENWEALWLSIKTIYANKSITHFLGSIVVLPYQVGRIQKSTLIDGQQRTTTFFSILVVLKELAIFQKKETLVNQIAIVNKNFEGYDHYKILLTEKENDRNVLLGFFNEKIENIFSKYPTHLITKCVKFFHQKIKDSNFDIDSLYDILIKNLKVALIELDTNDNPNIVFENLNSKGKKLAEKDVIRNYFFMRILESEQESVYKKYWQPIENAEEMKTEADFKNFIKHYLNKDGDKITEQEGYEKLKKSIQGDENNDSQKIHENAINALKKLHYFFSLYQKIIAPEKHEKDINLQKKLKDIFNLSSEVYISFLLSCYDDYQNEILTSKEMQQIADYIDNYLIRRFVVGAPTNQLLGVFTSLYKNAKKEGGKKGNFLSAVKKMLISSNYPSDLRVKEAILENKFYSKKQCCNLLIRIDESYQGSYEGVDYKNAEIEHIMPQSLNDAWKAALGENYTEVHETLLHTLGNLTLTNYNARLSNKDFSEKKKTYAESNYNLNNFFNSVNYWDKKAINARANELATRCLKIWHDLAD